MPHIRKLINLSTQLNRQGCGWRNSCSSKGYFSCSPTGLLVPASTKASKTDLQVYVEIIVKACPSSPPDVRRASVTLFFYSSLEHFRPSHCWNDEDSAAGSDKGESRDPLTRHPSNRHRGFAWHRQARCAADARNSPLEKRHRHRSRRSWCDRPSARGRESAVCAVGLAASTSLAYRIRGGDIAAPPCYKPERCGRAFVQSLE